MRSKPETLYTRFFPHLRNVRVIVRNSDLFIALFVPVVVGRVITLVLVFWLSFDTCSIYSADRWSIAWLTGLGDLISQKEICGHDLTVFCEAVSYSLSLQLFKLNSNWFELLQIDLTSLLKMTSMPFKQTVQLPFNLFRTRACSVWFQFFTLIPQSRRQSSSLSRMTEGEKRSGEPWNRRLSHWFSRGTKNTLMIGSFKLKVCLTLFSASAAYYKYARKGKLFAFRNFG